MFDDVHLEYTEKDLAEAVKDAEERGYRRGLEEGRNEEI